MTRFILITFLLLLSSSEFQGEVVSVIDGDTIEVLKNGNAVRIRLNGIDCPEKAQDFGTKAKQFTSDLIFGKTVRIREKEIDRYGRIIADVYVNDIWINEALVAAGLAWHYKHYSNDKQLAAAEIKARAKKIGLWRINDPVAPWDFRRRH